jgi:hypothetical protein
MKRFTDKKVNRGVVGVSVALIAVAIAVSLSSSAFGGSARHGGNNAVIALPSGAVLSQLKALATNITAQYGDNAPSGGQVTVATRQAANEVANGAEIIDSTPVYVVAVQGHFTSPRGGPFGVAPQGTVMTLVIDSATFDPLDLTLSQTTPNLGQLGPVEGLG